MARLSKKAQTAAKARKLFLTILVTWLCTLPLIILLQIITRFVIVELVPALHFLITIVNIVSVVGLVYGLFGWIAVIIAAVYWEGKK